MNSSESWWYVYSSDWKWPLKGVQSFFFRRLQTKTEEVEGQKRERMEAKRRKAVKRKGGCWRFRQEYRLFFRTENILLLKENQIPLCLRLVVYLWQRHRKERHSSWKPLQKKRNEKHREYQMVNLCLCWSLSLPLTKTHSPSYFPHNLLHTVRGSKQETENNKTSVFIVKYYSWYDLIAQAGSRW